MLYAANPPLDVHRGAGQEIVIIIGAGASGLMCAIESGRRGRKVLLLEHAEKVGRKILISGGGRCNFTNLDAKPECFLSDNPHFSRSALTRYTPNDFIRLMEKHKIKYREKKFGQLFCDGNSKEIVSMLLKECKEAGVEILVNCKVSAVKKEGRFSVSTNLGEFISNSLVIATGGVSIPEMGASDFGYKIAEQFGLKVTEIKPGLVPLTWNQPDSKLYGELSGVSIDSIVRCGKISFRENILFTHKGLSGPAILQISSYWKKGEPLVINLLPDIKIDEALNEKKLTSKVNLDNFLSIYLPRRFSEKWCHIYFKSKPVNRLTEKEISVIAGKLHGWPVMPAGTEGFAKAEVSKGGIDTDELSSKTMECRKVKGLYFIGEVLDVTGWLGGYNLQWAWSSGQAAGQYV
ncbi:MAG: NAD(P)/FAD-dependent oxidoreductase [Planctomycetota bacterium]